MLYQYLVGVFLLFLIWLFLFIIRKDLRKPMIWTGVVYSSVLICGFLAWFFLSQYFYLGEPIIPGYWNPETLFNLGRITGGLAIEDIFFMFFVGGIATSIYDFLFGKRISLKKSYKPHMKVLVIAGITVFLFVITLKFHNLNLIYGLIIPSFIGAICLWIDRRDLIKHSILGGFVFLFLYILAYNLYLLIFPNFIFDFYALHNLSGLIILGIPIEEYLYAFSFGMMWAPLYEYAHGEKDVDINKR